MQHPAPTPSDTPPMPAGNTHAAVPPFVHYTRMLAVSSLLSLVLLGLTWELWLAPLRPGGSYWALKVLPLLFALPGLLKNRMYTYRWLSLLVWLYFMEGVVRAYSDRAPSNYYAMLAIVFCLGLFAACALHVRLRLRHARTAHSATPTATRV